MVLNKTYLGENQHISPADFLESKIHLDMILIHFCSPNWHLKTFHQPTWIFFMINQILDHFFWLFPPLHFLNDP